MDIYLSAILPQMNPVRDRGRIRHKYKTMLKNRIHFYKSINEQGVMTATCL